MHTANLFWEEAEEDFEEYCPECGHTVGVKIDKEDPRFFLSCPHCGHKLLFCTMCWDEIDRSYCDWGKDHPCHMECRAMDWKNYFAN